MILQNKVANVTGAASGIGKAAAILLAKEGASVIISDINTEQGEEVAAEINNAGGAAFFIKADTSKPDDHKSLVEGTIAKYGGLDIAVNNAGIGGPLSPTGTYPIDGWQKVIEINLSGVFYALRYQIPAMKKTGAVSST